MAPRSPSSPSRAQLGTVRRLPSGRFQAYYITDGHKFTAPNTFPTARAGEEWLQAERVDRRRGAWLDPTVGSETLGAYALNWLSTRPDLAPRTRDYYERTLHRWVLSAVPTERGDGLTLGTFALHALTPALIRTWHANVRITARVGALARLTRTPRPTHPARAWARSVGRTVPTSGRLSPALIEEWEAAGSPTLVDPGSSAVESSHPDAGRTAAAQAYRVLRAILSTAHADGLIPSNPCRIKAGGIVHHRERTIATPAEVDALADLFPPRLRAAVILAAWSGLRYGEQFALARRHVDLEAGTIRVERAIEQIPGQPLRFGKIKTAASARTVDLPRFVVTELRAHMAHFVDAYPDALLFTRAAAGDPVPSQDLSRYMRKARAVIERPDLTWHDLRHTSATLAYRVGASTREVMDRLGHSTTRAAQIYAHTADDSGRLLASRLDDLRAPAPVAQINAGA
ncbi:tyrosine-type recombinase/integrase [Microbacterium sp. DT81.1]|uniref:tyrosine-type recombinase/integrase n=1 Tax=Microbacterium sp. DT81.1 TaxID=3393413 RepID=UPI003CEAE0AD